MGFCTVSDLEAFLQLAIPEAKIASAERAIEEASAAIVDSCRQQLEAVEDDELVVDGTGGPRLFLRELPVTGVAEVVEDGATLVEGDDYKLGAHGVLYRLGGVWAAGYQNILVTYSHGYAELPTTVVAVCTRAAARAYQAGLKAEQQEGVPGVQAESLGDHSVQFGAEQVGGDVALGASAARLLLPSERDALARYRI